MKTSNTNRLQPSRRHFLKAAGIGVALPWLERFSTRSVGATEVAPRRLVMICTTLGLHSPNFFPDNPGSDYTPSPYLELVQQHRSKLTVFSGLSHPNQAGADGHSSQRTWLTSAPHPGLGGFRNTISVDQLAAEKLGYVTRFPSMVLGTGGGSQSYTRSGVMIPAEERPSQVYANLFLEGTKHEIDQQIARLGEGRSILDTVSSEAKRLAGTSGSEDRQRLDEYFQSVREMERKLSAAEQWIRKPKPELEVDSPQDITNASDLIGRTRLMYSLIPLALQTDSTRVIAVTLQGRNDVPVVPGVSMDHHNLSHHGKDPAKLKQLELIERELMLSLDGLLTDLERKSDPSGSLLDSTSVLFGSNLGNANSHDWRNLPILLAGGGFRHGRYRAFDSEKNIPLSNLFLSLLQEQGHEVEHFGSSTGTLEIR